MTSRSEEVWAGLGQGLYGYSQSDIVGIAFAKSVTEARAQLMTALMGHSSEEEPLLRAVLRLNWDRLKGWVYLVVSDGRLVFSTFGEDNRYVDLICAELEKGLELLRERGADENVENLHRRPDGRVAHDVSVYELMSLFRHACVPADDRRNQSVGS